MKIIDLKEVNGTYVPVGEVHEQAQPRPRTRPPREKKPRTKPAKKTEDKTGMQTRPVRKKAIRISPEYPHNAALDDFLEGMSIVSKLFGGIR